MIVDSGPFFLKKRSGTANRYIQQRSFPIFVRTTHITDTLIIYNMLRLYTWLLLLLSLSIAHLLPAQTAAEQLDAMIEKGMTDWKIPGLAAVVIKDGKVAFKKTYGTKDIKTKEPVDDQTLFTMASTTKAMIAISLGMLVDEGKLDWNDKVIDHLPTFQLSDPYITGTARVQDLLTHNLGIGNADLLWSIDSVSTTETLRRFRLAEVEYPLRGGFTYQNIMYAVAGEVVGAVSGMHWTEFVQQRIFDPLGMDRSQAKSANIFKAGNYARPHYDDLDEGIVRVGPTLSDQIGAAGMIWSCLADMTKYLQFLLDGGQVDGKVLLQPKTFAYLFEPHAFVSTEEFYPTQKLTKPHWRTYGLGWFQHDYRGQKLDFHTGSIAGLVAIAGLVQDEDMAVYVFANLDHAELRHAIMYKAIDLFVFDDNSRDWHKEIFDMYSGLKAEYKKSLQKQVAERELETRPTLPLIAYTGTYVHDMYGTITITERAGKLLINFNDFLKLSATHWHYDTFRTSKHPDWRQHLFLHFHQNGKGDMNRIEAFGRMFKKK
jgi:CubicO group peptidase (beta-lactamase class C family)